MASEQPPTMRIDHSEMVAILNNRADMINDLESKVATLTTRVGELENEAASLGQINGELRRQLESKSTPVLPEGAVVQDGKVYVPDGKPRQITPRCYFISDVDSELIVRATGNPPEGMIRRIYRPWSAAGESKPPVPPAGETASDGSVMIDGMKLTPVPKEQIGTFTFQDAADIEAQTPINSPAPEPSPAGTVEGLVRTIERALNHATYPSRPIDGRNEIQIGNEAHVALTALASERETLEGLLREADRHLMSLRIHDDVVELRDRIDAALSHKEKQAAK